MLWRKIRYIQGMHQYHPIQKKVFFLEFFYFELTDRRICFAFRFDIISKAVNDCSAISIEVILRN